MATTAQALLRDGQARLRTAGIENAVLDARLLLQDVLGWTHAQLMTKDRDTVPEAAMATYGQVLDRRCAFEPVSRIIGHREFWSLDFVVGPAVLDPRPDTETLVQAVLDSIDDKTASLSLLDLGTGSGCILIALLSELPNARGIAVDRSVEALVIARDNAERLGVLDRTVFLCGDWGQAVVPQGADIVVSNPPYIETEAMGQLMPEVAKYDPSGALDGGADGLDAYRDIVADLPRLLRPKGNIFMELGLGQSSEVAILLEEISTSSVLLVKDLARIDRCIHCAI